MDISIFLAQVFGLYFIVIGLPLFLRPSVLAEVMQAAKQRAFTLLGGIMAILIGLPLVLLHTVWEMSWVGVITLLVWIVLLKGVLLIAAPELFVGLSSTFARHPRRLRYGLLLFVLFGAYLSAVGFGWW